MCALALCSLPSASVWAQPAHDATARAGHPSGVLALGFLDGLPAGASDLILLAFIVVIFSILFLVWNRISNKKVTSEEVEVRAWENSTSPQYRPEGWNGVDLTSLSVALDPASRSFVEERLARLTAEVDMATVAGKGALCRGASRLLSDVSPAWRYAGAKNFRPMDAVVAQSEFRALATDYGSRSGLDKKLGAGGAAAYDRVAVVSLVVAARSELLDLSESGGASEVKLGLSGLGMLGDAALVAVEVVWSPADGAEGMRARDLEAGFPELQKVDPQTAGRRAACRSCSGPYNAELKACPHCAASGGGRAG